MSDNKRQGKRFRSNHGYKNRDNRRNHENRDERDSRDNRSREAQQRQREEQEIFPREIISQEFVCPICNKQIVDLASSLADRKTGEPLHFDCILKQLQETEKLEQNQKITYIGQGRFAVVYFKNPQDTREFSIIRIIEWEEREKKFDWRSKIASQFSQVK